MRPLDDTATGLPGAEAGAEADAVCAIGALLGDEMPGDPGGLGIFFLYILARNFGGPVRREEGGDFGRGVLVQVGATGDGLQAKGGLAKIAGTAFGA